jgi:hypothetical protein
MLRPKSTVRYVPCHCLSPCARFLIAHFPKVIVDLQFVRTRTHPNLWRQSLQYIPVLLPSPQVLCYFSLAASSFLIVLRMFVVFWNTFCEAYGDHQIRYLGQESGYSCSRDWYMGNQHCIPHSGWVHFLHPLLVIESHIHVSCGIRCFAGE